MKKRNLRFPKNIRYTLITVSFLILATATGYLFRWIGFPEANIVLAYLLAVLLTARYSEGYIYGMMAAVASIFLYNYFFTEPYYTLAVNNPSYVVTFVIMMITAGITSALTSFVKKSATEAHEREAETKALYLLMNHLTDTTEIRDVAAVAADIIGNTMNCKAACLCFSENGLPEKTYVQRISHDESVRRNTKEPDELANRLESLQSGYFTDMEFCNWPIYGGESVLGLIRIPADTASAMNEAQVRLLRAMTENIALAMDRIKSARQRNQSQQETIQERYRADLLRAISHDLRTPLSGIMGTSEMLIGMTEKRDPRYELATQINSDADWLHALVENILSLTRLRDGKLMLNKQPEAVEEIVSEAVRHINQRSPGYEIAVDIPHELYLVPMDAKLIMQVLINLLDNAIKHSAPGNPIVIMIKHDSTAKEAVFIVADRGDGISPADLPHIFDLFYTSGSETAASRHGMGLGLSICEAIVKAHGGTITAHNRNDGPGAEFVFTLPMEVSET